MHSVLYVVNYNNTVDSIKIESRKLPYYSLGICEKIEDNTHKNQITFKANPLEVQVFLNEINVSDCYRKNLVKKLRKLDQKLVIVTLIPLNKEFIDYSWNYRIQLLLWERIELENLMSWFSTLGGAFSSLGDQFINYADIAGRISVEQLKLALRIGDPITVSRCKLYFVLSLIQKGYLKKAKEILIKEYHFALTQLETDKRLWRMCLGIWEKLKYTAMLKRHKSKNISKLKYIS